MVEKVVSNDLRVLSSNYLWLKHKDGIAAALTGYINISLAWLTSGVLGCMCVQWPASSVAVAKFEIRQPHWLLAAAELHVRVV